jgi:hypothetical protein
VKLLIKRIRNYKHSDKQTIGTGYVFNENNGIKYTFCTLELPWKDNERRISCIPNGEYEVIKHVSPKFGNCLWVQDVPERSEILVHHGNYNWDTLGCVLVGRTHKDINNDGLLDVAASRGTMFDLLQALPDKFTMKIEWS